MTAIAESTEPVVPRSRHYRLIRPVSPSAIEPTDEQRAVIEHDRGRLRVLAGPGTGKTATIVESVADRIVRRGLEPQSILVLTYSRRAAGELADRISGRVEVTTTEPMVRTVHGYAYALLRAHAAAHGEPAPALLPGGQADLMVREILAGHADAGGAYWPVSHHAALRVPAFAAELRELMLRAAERTVTPKRLATLGARLGRPEWVAAARFMSEYRDIADLRQGTTRRGSKLDQAELIGAALTALSEPGFLAAQRQKVRRIFVDEYQDVDPAQAALIELLAGGADELVVVGDPDQAIYSFRGAAPGVMAHVQADTTVALSVCRRMPRTVTEATRRLAALIPGVSVHRDLQHHAEQADGRLDIRVFPSPRQEAAYVADQLRRAHIEGGTPWSRMAVLLRSGSTAGPLFRAALQAVGVPVADDALRPLARQPLVAALLAVLRAGSQDEPLDGDSALELLSSPLGGLDVLAVRRLRRSIRQWTDRDRTAEPGDETPRGSGADGPMTTGTVIARIVCGLDPLPPDLSADLAQPLRRLTALITIARDRRDEPVAESVLWDIWRASGLEAELLAASAQGGPGGSRADADLDAVIELFQRSTALAAELPFPGIGGLLGLLADEEVTGRRRDTAGEAVAVMSAHAAKGLEWDVVAVAGVQEDVWPDLRPRSGLLHQRAMLDAADGITTALPATSALADERRLFYVATSRAREQLLVTAVDSTDATPSRFLTELSGAAEVDQGWPADCRGRTNRTLQLPDLVAELRQVVCAQTEGGSAQRRTRAAHVLAMLATAGVRGAHPREWYGLAALSTNETLLPAGAPVSLSPSQVESVQECSLRTVLERHGGRLARQQHQMLGIAVHALAEGLGRGATTPDLDRAVGEFLDGQVGLAPWERDRLRRRISRMRAALEYWITRAARSRRFVGSELAVDVTVPADAPGESDIRIRGRIDWLTFDEADRVVITDFKTGSSKPTIAAAESHAQLATYQLAVALGGLAATFDGQMPEIGGAELVYLSSGKPEVRSQSAHSDETRSAWLTALRDVARRSTGPHFVAQQGEYCARCPVRSSCPIQPEGRQVTS